jgi:hypothetical protein
MDNKFAANSFYVMLGVIIGFAGSMALAMGTINHLVELLIAK